MSFLSLHYIVYNPEVFSSVNAGRVLPATFFYLLSLCRLGVHASIKGGSLTMGMSNPIVVCLKVAASFFGRVGRFLDVTQCNNRR